MRTPDSKDPHRRDHIFKNPFFSLSLHIVLFSQKQLHEGSDSLHTALCYQKNEIEQSNMHRQEERGPSSSRGGK
jgi:hypothetical protein